MRLVPVHLERRQDVSRWNTAQGEWVASGFDLAVRKAMPRGEQWVATVMRVVVTKYQPRFLGGCSL